MLRMHDSLAGSVHRGTPSARREIGELAEKIDAAAKLGLISSLKPDFLEQMAEYFTEVE